MPQAVRHLAAYRAVSRASLAATHRARGMQGGESAMVAVLCAAQWVGSSPGVPHTAQQSTWAHMPWGRSAASLCVGFAVDCNMAGGMHVAASA